MTPHHGQGAAIAEAARDGPRMRAAADPAVSPACPESTTTAAHVAALEPPYAALRRISHRHRAAHERLDYGGPSHPHSGVRTV